MREETLVHPRTWVFWVVVASLILTVVGLGVTALWFGTITSVSFWWLVFGMPQVSVALLAALICWAPNSRPIGFLLAPGIVALNIQGLVFSVAYLKWEPAVIGVLTIITLKLWPKANPVIEPTASEWQQP